MSRRIMNVLELIKQGKNIKDKISIFLFYLLKQLGLKSLPFRTTIKNEFGTFFCEKSEGWLGHSSKDYEPKVQEQLILKKGVFVDIGAHIGRFSLQVAKGSKEVKVIAIEPEESNFFILSKNIKLNNLKNIFAIRIGCSEKEGTAPFYVLGKGSGGNSLIPQKEIKKKIEIPVNTLDNLIQDLKLKNLNLLKIDVEGAEIKVLKGGKKSIKKYHPKILFECWSDEKLAEIKSFLENFNYTIKKIDNNNNYLGV